MAYCTLADVRGPSGALDQLTEDSDRDDLLTTLLTDATAFINAELGITTDLAAAAPSTFVAYGDGTPWLALPTFTAGSVTAITGPSGYTVPTYVEADGFLRVADSGGVYVSSTLPSWYRSWTGSGVWEAGVPYTVSATFGATDNDMAVLRAITRELVVQLFRFKDAGGSQVLSTEEALINMKNSYSPIIQAQLGHLKRRVNNTVGIW